MGAFIWIEFKGWIIDEAEGSERFRSSGGSGARLDSRRPLRASGRVKLPHLLMAAFPLFTGSFAPGLWVAEIRILGGASAR